MPGARRKRFGRGLAAFALPLLALWLWQCKFPVMREPTTLLDVTLVDSLTAANGYERVKVEVFDGNGNILKTPFDGSYDAAVHGRVLRDIDLGTSPPKAMEIRITGTKTDGRTVVFVKKIANGVAEKVWTQTKGPGPVPDPGPDPDTATKLSLLPEDLYILVDSVAILDVEFLSGAGDSLVWVSSDPEKAVPLGGGRVKGVSPGTATITASSFREPSARDSVRVRVSKAVDSVASIRLDPGALTVYTGGKSRTVAAAILPDNPDNVAQFSSLAGNIAQVDRNGAVTGLQPGQALIVAHPVGHTQILDTCTVTVKTDKPVIDAGAARKVDLNVAAAFPVKVTQEYGALLVLKWDLDGDGTWEDSVLNADTARPSFAYPSARTYKARFQARDEEGNIDSATVTVVAGGNAPLVDITRPGRDTLVNTPVFRLEYTVNSVPRAREVRLEYGRHKVGVSDTVAGEIGGDSVYITLDTIPPKVKITAPAAGAQTRAASVTVAWMVDSVYQSSLPTESLAGRQGAVKIVREAFDGAGNRGADSVILVRDTVNPKVVIQSPREGETVYKTAIPVKWRVDDQEQTLDTTEILSAGYGPKRIVRSFTDAAGNRDSMVVNVVLDRLTIGKPVLIASGTTPSPTRKDTFEVTIGPGGNGSGVYRYGINTSTPGRTTGRITGNYTFSFPAPDDGLYTFRAQEGDDQGNWSDYLVHAIAVDRTPPQIAIAGGDRTVSADTFTVTATVQDTGAGAGVIGPVTLSGSAAGTLALSGGKYSLRVTLAAGLNTLTVSARDSAGNTGTKSVGITYQPPPFKVLMFNKAFQFEHSLARGPSTDLIKSELPTLLDTTPRFTVDTANDTARLTSAFLSAYDVLILNNASGLSVLGTAKRAAIMDFAAVKGVVAIHGTIEMAWPELAALLGGSSTLHSTLMSATLNNAAASHGINTGLPATFTSTDEWHAFSPNPASDPAITPLWTLDETSPGLPGSILMGNHPIVWCKTLPGGGRFFYTSQGHDGTNYVKTGMLGRLLYNAIVWAAKRDR